MIDMPDSSHITVRLFTSVYLLLWVESLRSYIRQEYLTADLSLAALKIDQNEIFLLSKFYSILLKPQEKCKFNFDEPLFGDR